MTRLVFALPLLLTACAIPPEAAQPTAATIRGTELRVTFSDGGVCRAALGPEGGQGELACPQGGTYDVRIDKPNLLEPVFGDAVAPYADIAVTRGDGRTFRFRTPVSRDFRENEFRVD